MLVKIFITLIFFLVINQIIQVKSVPINNSITSKMDHEVSFLKLLTLFFKYAN